MERTNWLTAINVTISICLFLLFVCIPLTVNPCAEDAWYKPKIDAICVLIVIITLAGAFKHFYLGDHLRYRPLPLLLPLVAYAASAILSTIFSVAPQLSLFGDPMREEGISTLLAYAALTVLFSQLVASEKQFHLLMLGLIGASLLIALNAIANYGGYYPIGQLVHQRGYLGPGVGSTVGNPNFLGKFLVLILPLSLAYGCASRSRVQTLYGTVAFLACLVALVLTFTRASWLAFFIEMIIFFSITGRMLLRKKGVMVAGTAIVTCVVAALLYWGGAQDSGRDFFDLAGKKIYGSFDFGKGRGVATRLFVWEKTIGMVRERPLFGFGPDAQSKAMEAFNLEYCLRFNDWSIADRGDQRVIRFSGLTLLDRAHNNYLDVALTQGLVGLAAYLATVITFLVWLIRTLRGEKNSSLRIIYCGLAASFCGYLVNDIFIFSVVSVSPTFWSLMGLTLAVKSHTSELTPC